MFVGEAPEGGSRISSLRGGLRAFGDEGEGGCEEGLAILAASYEHTCRKGSLLFALDKCDILGHFCYAVRDSRGHYFVRRGMLRTVYRAVSSFRGLWACSSGLFRPRGRRLGDGAVDRGGRN